MEAFLANMSAERGLSENTLTAYRYDLTQFLDALAAQDIVLVKAITPGHVYGFLAGLRRAGLRPASIARKTISVKLWMQFLCRDGHLAADPTLAVETGKAGTAPADDALPARDRAPADSATGGDTGGPARPGDARNHVRLRPARLRAGCPEVRRYRPARPPHPPFRQGRQGAPGPPRRRRPRHPVTPYLATARPALLAKKPPTPYLFVTRQGGPMTRQPLPRSGQSLRPAGRHRPHHLPPRPAPLLRHPPALRRGRPARHPGDARPRQRPDHPALHPRRRGPSARGLRPDAPACLMG